ncbi:forkhead domain-containing protein [Ditylenchus destructor]|uniref:Forkhead domain-containing protein n=1 Tax=Ditylenchus destructor TaxID=166010 RepID=A0AAD4MZC8_9BILA|nr:forkhead domain-containing protein [Ditylenchus destructor]
MEYNLQSQLANQTDLSFHYATSIAPSHPEDTAFGIQPSNSFVNASYDTNFALYPPPFVCSTPQQDELSEAESPNYAQSNVTGFNAANFQSPVQNLCASDQSLFLNGSDGSHGNENSADRTKSTAKANKPTGSATKITRSSLKNKGEKPPGTYIELIATAIEAQPDKRATLNQIYKYLQDKHEFFRSDYIGWKNSIRHNLSIGTCFIKLKKDDKTSKAGKGHHWIIGPDYIDSKHRKRIVSGGQENEAATKVSKPSKKKKPAKNTLASNGHISQPFIDVFSSTNVHGSLPSAALWDGSSSSGVPYDFVSQISTNPGYCSTFSMTNYPAYMLAQPMPSAYNGFCFDLYGSNSANQPIANYPTTQYPEFSVSNEPNNVTTAISNVVAKDVAEQNVNDLGSSVKEEVKVEELYQSDQDAEESPTDTWNSNGSSLVESNETPNGFTNNGNLQQEFSPQHTYTLHVEHHSVNIPTTFSAFHNPAQMPLSPDPQAQGMNLVYGSQVFCPGFPSQDDFAGGQPFCAYEWQSSSTPNLYLSTPSTFDDQNDVYNTSTANLSN